MSEAERIARYRAIALRLTRLPALQREQLLKRMTAQDVRLIEEFWRFWAHNGQLSPPGDWRIWLIRAGRGFGKTRAGAEWVSDIARRDGTARIALVAGTLADARAVMVEGESGILSVARSDETPVWSPSNGEIAFDSGARAYLYSAVAAERLRGPQHHAAWCDELAKWRNGTTAWNNLLLGLRLGDQPQALVTTTPRPGPLMRQIMAMPGLVETSGRTRDNPHLPDSFVAAMERDYAGTRLGRQELDGELVEDVPGALWNRTMIEQCRVVSAPELARIVVAVDPPAGSERGSGDACGIVVAGVGTDGLGYVLEDASVAGTSPEGWARAVADCAARHEADRVVAEKNQGGEMVRHVLESADAALPIRLVHASRGKSARAEPIAAKYERGLIKHAGRFPELEDQMCGLIAGGGYVGPGRSPDRADALVWALTDLMLGQRGEASVRAILN